jgi:hypothetical protein
MVMATSLTILLLGCIPLDTSGPDSGSNRSFEEAGREASATCPDWRKAPAGDVWHGRYLCSSCGDAWWGVYLDEGRAVTAWSPSGWPCDCIDDDGLIKDIPECWGSE